MRVRSLSLAGAAQLHGIRVDTVKNGSVGRRTVPAGAWDELRAYEAQIVDRAEAMRELWEENPSDIEIVAEAADHSSLMAAAAFIMGLSEGSHVFDSGTEATALARPAGRANEPGDCFKPCEETPHPAHLL